jgi:hypothetical protein
MATATVLVLTSAAGAAEPSLYEGRSWEDGQRAAAQAAVVILVKITEAGKISGNGWNGSVTQSRGRNEINTGTVEVSQEAGVEILETLRGKATGPLRVRIQKLDLDYQFLAQCRLRLRGNRSRMLQGLPASMFALNAGRTYLLWLDEPTQPDPSRGSGTPLLATHLPAFAPIEAPEALTLASIRAFCSELAIWDSPPELSDAEKQETAALVFQLGSDDFAAREKASAALRARGTRMRRVLEQAAAGPDEERADRARHLLEQVRPKPGAVEFPGPPDARQVPPPPTPVAGGRNREGTTTTDGASPAAEPAGE